MATIISTGNFKGGVGKTTNCVMLAYTLAKMGKKILLVDFDPQSDATKLLMNTMAKVFDVTPVFETTLAVALKSGDIESALINVMPNLDLLPSYSDLQTYEAFLYDNFDSDFEKDTYFSKQLNKISDNYDFIFIDVPPQLNKYTDSALTASNFVIVILQTQERALNGAETFISHIQTLAEDYNLNLDIVGILPVLVQNGNELDQDVLQDAREIFNEVNLFESTIKQMARLKRFDRTGITELSSDIHDKRVHKVYNDVAVELLQRIEMFNEEA
ncbi:ParA family protein [Culicoidibacter larvae]|uniref:ParA family protein n=1 Tax=Culicoidibacter larvae TaxID=2579976 RepID=A0A5R8Q7B6_9FIRM|nr:ParA family protein [Culicoidibacter larvae]TLG70261.1 ParA family protein [Culicoidibacter larvae]